MCWIEGWVKRQCQVRHNVQTLTTGFSQILPADPLRFGLLVPTSGASATTFAFGDLQPPTQAWIVNTTVFVGWVNDEEIGELITFPFWGKVNAGTFTADFITLSYNPTRKMFYDKYCEQQLARLGSP